MARRHQKYSIGAMRSSLRHTRRWWRIFLRLWVDSALRLFVRSAPSERQRVFILTLLTGAACGVAAVAFHEAILFSERLLIDRALHTPMPWLVAALLGMPAAGGLVAGIVLYYVVPDARGSGIPQVKVAYEVKGGMIPFRVAVGKFALGALQIGTGGSLGREGPTVQICAAVA
ncbi:MAG TPA: chloride channel protein, partial [Roseiflexaceae bacterium]|nr:chloride channel protein [Roseiflexaceae bacterium]